MPKRATLVTQEHDWKAGLRKILFSPILQRLLHDPEIYLDRICEDGESFAIDVARQTTSSLPTLGSIPTLASVGMYAFGPEGNIIAKVCPDGWSHELSPADVLDQLPESGTASRILFLRFPQGVIMRAVCLDSRAAN